jgi:hypothetical protein
MAEVGADVAAEAAAASAAAAAVQYPQDGMIAQKGE